MAREDNLIPLNERSKDAAKVIQTAGGIARGKQQTEQKSMREWAKIFGAMPVQVKAPDGKVTETTTLGNIVAAQMAKATKGDTKAAKFVADLLGEMEQNINLKGGVVPVVVTPEEKAAIDKWTKKDD